jgi:hypothetical protein
MNILKRRLTVQQFKKATQQERDNDIALSRSRAKLKQRAKRAVSVDKLTLGVLIYIAVIITLSA